MKHQKIRASTQSLAEGTDRYRHHKREEMEHFCGFSTMDTWRSRLAGKSDTEITHLAGHSGHPVCFHGGQLHEILNFPDVPFNAWSTKLFTKPSEADWMADWCARGACATTRVTPCVGRQRYH